MNLEGLYEQVKTIPYDEIPAWVEALKMVGLGVTMFKHGTMKSSFSIEDRYFEIYSPSWEKHHGNKRS